MGCKWREQKGIEIIQILQENAHSPTMYEVKLNFPGRTFEQNFNLTLGPYI
jgi:hypothetical protein